MSSNPLSTQMQALIDYANETTGEADTDLSAAVDHLAKGYGGGSYAEFELVETVSFDGTLSSYEYNFAKPAREFMLVIDLTFSSSYTAQCKVNDIVTSYFTYNTTAASTVVRFVHELTPTMDGFVAGTSCSQIEAQDSVTYFKFYDRYSRSALITGTIDIYAIYA